MNLLTIAWKSNRERLVASTLTTLSVALGVMLMVAVLVIHGILGRVFNQQAIGYDLIVGPKGSEMQLVLSAVYRVSPPIENLPYKYYEELKKDPRVRHAIPLCFGDTTDEEHGAFPIVGTTSRFFMVPYAPNEQFQIKGKTFATSLDAIIGSEVAKKNNWDIGAQFKMVHGGADSDHVHDEKFTVVGILKRTNTPNDKTVFIHLNGFFGIADHGKPMDQALRRWHEFSGENIDAEMQKFEEQQKIDNERRQRNPDAHIHHEVSDYQKEVTAILVNIRRPPTEFTEKGKFLTLAEKGEDEIRATIAESEGPDAPSTVKIYENIDALAAEYPAAAEKYRRDRWGPSTAALLLSSELKKGYKAQGVNPIVPMKQLMTAIIGNIQIVLLVLTSLIIIVSGLGIFVSIYNSMSDRRKEIAVMRALGASRRTVFSIILIESILLCTAGGTLGLLLGHGLVFVAAPLVEARSGLLIDPFAFETVELLLVPGLVMLASLVGFIPAMTAYRTDVAKALSK